jgi:hypothetical protein
MTNNTYIAEFVPGRGYRAFVSAADLVAFRKYVAGADAQERQYYSLTSSEEPADGGAFYFLGLHRTRQDMDDFLIKWTLRIDRTVAASV